MTPKIESTFIEIICSKSTNVIVGWIYKYPTFSINDFANDFISPLLLKLQKESSKRIFLLGDFNIDLSKYEIPDSTNNFIDTLSSNFLLPLIFLPTRISKASTLIDDIFSNGTSLEETEPGNVTSTFSDRLPQFILLPDFFSKVPVIKSNIMRSDWKKFESSKSISDFNQIYWEQILYNEKNNVNFSMNEYLSKIDSLLDTHAPLKKLNKKELKLLNKPWITQGLQNYIKKNNIYSKFVKCKNKILKEFHHNSYKNYRNLLSTLLKRAKGNYFTNFLNENIKDIKKTWKGIKNLVSMKQKDKDTPSLITKDEKYIKDPISIGNTFNDFFTSVAEIVHSKIKFSKKSFRNFLSLEIDDFFIITSRTKEEIYKIISSLNANKSCGPNSISTKVLHLLQDQISNHLATICNLSLSAKVFLSIQKTAKVIPIHKKNSKLEVSNYMPILLKVSKN